MDPTSRLARNLVEESKAYGYTLTILGAGALLIHHYGMPGIVQTGLYIGGALAAIAALTVVAFGGFLTERKMGGARRLVSASMVHVVATGGNLLVSFLLIVGGRRFGLGRNGAFLLVGFQATLLYNLLLLLEHATVETLK